MLLNCIGTQLSSSSMKQGKQQYFPPRGMKEKHTNSYFHRLSTFLPCAKKCAVNFAITLLTLSTTALCVRYCCCHLSNEESEAAWSSLWTYSFQGQSVCCDQLLHCTQIFATPIDCSPPDSSVSKIFQARVLKWVAISYSRASSQPKGRTHVSWVSCIGRWVLYHWATREALRSTVPLSKCEDVNSVRSTVSPQYLVLTPRSLCNSALLKGRLSPRWRGASGPQVVPLLPSPGKLYLFGSTKQYASWWISLTPGRSSCLIQDGQQAISDWVVHGLPSEQHCMKWHGYSITAITTLILRSPLSLSKAVFATPSKAGNLCTHPLVCFQSTESSRIFMTHIKAAMPLPGFVSPTHMLTLSSVSSWKMLIMTLTEIRPKTDHCQEQQL